MDARIVVPGRRDRSRRARDRGGRAERVSGAGDHLFPVATSTEGERDERSDYWLTHCEGFDVAGPDGRIGSVAVVLTSGSGIDGLLIRTGLLRARTVFVPVDKVGSVTPRRRRVQLTITPDAPRPPISHIVRELGTLGMSSRNGSGPLVGTGGRDRE